MSETQVEVEAEQQTDEKTQGKLGSLLKSYRERSSHDIHEVAEALCLSPTIVKALEEEDFDSLPEPPYIRGYLRSYAKFAEVDSKEIIELYEAQRGADPQDLEYHFKPYDNATNKLPVSTTTLRLGLTALLLIVLASLSMIPTVNSWIGETWAGFSKQTAQQNYNNASNNENTLAINQVEQPAPLPGDEPKEPQKDSPTTKDAEDKKADSPTSSNNTSKPLKDKETDLDKKDNPDNTTQTEDNKEIDGNEIKTKEDKEGIKLRFVFKKEVWMRIKDNNKKIVFESLSPAGEEKELRLKTPLTFRIGNAQGIEVYVEGKRLDITKSTTGSVATFKIE